MSSIPILKSINQYEEKILLIVSRINFDSSQVEKLKLNVCSQLLNLDTLDWLKYNYCEVMSIQYDQFDSNIVNSQHDLKNLNSEKQKQSKLMKREVVS